MLSEMGISVLSYLGLIFPDLDVIIWAVVRNYKLKIFWSGGKDWDELCKTGNKCCQPSVSCLLLRSCLYLTFSVYIKAWSCALTFTMGSTPWLIVKYVFTYGIYVYVVCMYVFFPLSPFFHPPHICMYVCVHICTCMTENKGGSKWWWCIWFPWEENGTCSS